MKMSGNPHNKLFDQWADQYDAWFTTPMGKRVKQYECELILDLLQPAKGESILDVGCGTGIFTLGILAHSARIVGLEPSLPMLAGAVKRTMTHPFDPVGGDMRALPFRDRSFDKLVSVTALEFVADAKGAVDEMFRVVRPGGTLVVATLNSLSPWADRRKESAAKGHELFQNVFFRSPSEMQALASVNGEVKTAVHFQKHEEPANALAIEAAGQETNLDTGAFLAIRWTKP